MLGQSACVFPSEVCVRICVCVWMCVFIVMNWQPYLNMIRKCRRVSLPSDWRDGGGKIVFTFSKGKLIARIFRFCLWARNQMRIVFMLSAACGSSGSSVVMYLAGFCGSLWGLLRGSSQRYLGDKDRQFPAEQKSCRKSKQLEAQISCGLSCNSFARETKWNFSGSTHTHTHKHTHTQGKRQGEREAAVACVFPHL